MGSDNTTVPAQVTGFQVHPRSKPCPSCGRCPTCGKGGHNGWYPNPWPYQPYQPHWTSQISSSQSGISGSQHVQSYNMSS